MRLWLIAVGLLLAGPALAQDSVRVAVSAIPPSLGDPYQGNGPPGSLVWSAMFDGLTRLDEEWQLAPALATDWRNVSPTRWEFTLRENVRFHNGEALDAAAVQASIDWLLSEAGRATVIGGEVAGIARAQALGPLTLAIETERPDAILPNRLSAMMVVAPEAWTRLGPAGFARTPSGTGSYRLERWDNARAELVADPQSWRPAQIGNLVFIENPDNSARVQALLAGQVEISGIGPDDVPMVRGRGLSVHAGRLPQVFALAFRNVGNPDSPLQDVRVRQALNHAVDKQGIADGLMRGLVRPASQGAASMTTGYDPALEPYAYDPNRARALLMAAGYPDGFALQALVVAGSAPSDALIYQKVAQDLSRIGVQVELRSTVFPNLIRRYFSGEWEDIDAFGLSWNAAPYNDAIRPIEYYSCAKRNPFFCDEAVMEQIEAVGAIMDLEAREAALQALAADIRESAPALFLLEMSELMGYSARLTGLPTANRVVQYHRLSYR